MLSYFRRHWVLTGSAALLALYAATASYERQWRLQGEVFLGATADQVFPWLGDMARWGEWLVWEEYPFPTLVPIRRDGVAVTDIVAPTGKSIMQLSMASQDPPRSLTHNLVSTDDAIAGWCTITLDSGRYSNTLRWDCQGVYDDSGWRAVALRFGATPTWPYNLRASMRRLQQRFPP